MNAHSVPASAVRREREKQERRAAILAAAEKVIIDRGFAEVSMDGIAREAGLAAGTVYLYFPNKEALFQDLLSSKVRQLNDAVAAETGKDRVFSKTLPAVVMAMFRHFEAHHGFFEIFVRERVELSRGAPQTEGVLAEIETGTRQMPEGIADQARNCFATIAGVLTEAGFEMADIVRVQYTVVAPELVEALVPVLGATLGQIRPAATMVIAGLIRPEMKVEIEVTAFRG